MAQGIVKCPICGRPYRWAAHTVADQSACPRCVREANEEADKYNMDFNSTEPTP